MKATPTFICALLLCGAVSAQDLPPDIMADMYLLDATQALESGDAKEAIRAFGKIEALDTEPPPEFAFFYGKLLVENGATFDDLLKGQRLLKSYVIRIAKDSEHYTPALKLLSKASRSLERIAKKEAEARRAEVARQAEAARITAQLEVVCAGVETENAKFAHRWPRGKEFRDCVKCPEMVVVPAGCFLMGSPLSEKRRGSDEGPVHRVGIAEPFAVGVYEVTYAEWDACVSDGGCGRYRPWDGAGGVRP